MKFSYNWIKEYVNLKEEPQKVADVLTVRAAEVELISTKDKDTIFDIDILPNRGDLLSHFGMARELALLFEAKLKDPKISFKEAKGGEVQDMLKVKIEDKNLCPRYSAKIMKGVTVKESPKWLKDYLTAVGLRPINSIVDATNFVMIELGQPLHAFDYEKIGGQTIIVRNAKKGEKIIAIDEERSEYDLDESVLIVADDKRPMAIAGVKGGTGTEITKKTDTIVIESANFSPSLIRATSKKIDLKTDASIRFTYKVDLNLTAKALDRAVTIIQEISGGEVVPGLIDVCEKLPELAKVSIDKKYSASIIGVKIPDAEVLSILKRLFENVEDGENQWIVEVPTFRPDINSQEDVIEEIARVYGYDKILAIPPQGTIYPSERPIWERNINDDSDKFKDLALWDTSDTIRGTYLIREILKGMSFSEIMNYSLISDKSREVFKFEKAVKLLNPMSQQFSYLRPTLLPGIIESVEKNIKNFDDFNLFEIGRVFDKSDNSIREKRELAGVHVVSTKEETFFEAKGIIESFLEQLGICGVRFEEGGLIPVFHPKKHALISVNEKTIGEVGEVNPKISHISNIPDSAKVILFRFDLIKLINLIKEEIEFEPIPKYPAMIRDISILVDESVTIGRILEEIQSNDSQNIIRDVDVFDIFEGGENVSNEKKSVAFHIIFRSLEKTLTDKEVNEAEDQIKEALKSNLGAEVR